MFSHIRGDTDRLLKAISYSTDIDSTSADFTICHLKSTFETLRRTEVKYASPRRITNFLRLVDTNEDVLIRIAIEYHITGYVRRHLTASVAQGTEVDSLLTYALYPAFSAEPLPEMISCILEARETPGWSLYSSKWWAFVAKLTRKPQATPISSAKIQTVEFLIKHKVFAPCPNFNYFMEFNRDYSDAKWSNVTIINVLEGLAITDTQLDRSKLALRNLEQAEIFDPRIVKYKKKRSRPRESKQGLTIQGIKGGRPSIVWDKNCKVMHMVRDINTGSHTVVTLIFSVAK